ASPSRQRPSIRKPVPKSQWTCSDGGCIALTEVLEDARQYEEVEEQSDGHHEQRRLDDEPPEALVVGMEQRQAIRLRECPDCRREHRERPDRRDGARAPRSVPRCFEF